MNIFLRDIFLFYFRISFTRINTDALTAGERAELIRRHDIPAGWLLLLGTLFMLPFLFLYAASVVALATGQELLFGDTVDRRMFEGAFGLFIVQFLLVAAVSILCLTKRKYKGRGLVLALANILHLSPRSLQNGWRVLVLLPFVPIAGVMLYDLYEYILGWYYLG